MFVVFVEHGRGLLVLCNIIAVVAARAHLPRKLQGFAHREDGRMQLLLVRVGGQLADQVLAAVDGVAVVEDLALQVRRADDQLPRKSFQERGLA